ncbi:hypothetical protein EPO04_04050 [Patescibacteria group bacterium]|nr:MAG: hypothetical protein EPO04_04050 [Patescibacteria group bacterium]
MLNARCISVVAAALLSLIVSQANAGGAPAVPDGINLYYDVPTHVVYVQVGFPLADQEEHHCKLELQRRFRGKGWVAVAEGYADSGPSVGRCEAYGKFAISSLRRMAKSRPLRIQGYVDGDMFYSRRLTRKMLRHPTEYMTPSYGPSG